MGIFSRLSDIISSNLVSILDRAEDPQKLLRLMIQEMEDTLVEVKSQTAKMISEHKTIEKREELLLEDLAEWKRKAEFAVGANRDDLARLALSEKSKAQIKVDEVAKELKASEEQLAKMRSDIAQLQAKLEEARVRGRSLASRQETAKNQLKVRKSIERSSRRHSEERFAQLEQRIYDMEGEVELAGEQTSETERLKNELQSIEFDQTIENELQAIKAKLNGSKATPTEFLPAGTESTRTTIDDLEVSKSQLEA